MCRFIDLLPKGQPSTFRARPPSSQPQQVKGKSKHGSGSSYRLDIEAQRWDNDPPARTRSVHEQRADVCNWCKARFEGGVSAYRQCSALCKRKGGRPSSLVARRVEEGGCVGDDKGGSIMRGSESLADSFPPLSDLGFTARLRCCK
jgi:hypothetical protein